MQCKAQCNSSAFGRVAARHFTTRRAPTRRGNVTSSGDDEIDRFRALALLVGLDIEADALALDQRFQPSAFNSGDVHEYVAAAVVGLDETVAAFTVEELDRTTHCHRATPPRGRFAVCPHGTTARLDIHTGKENSSRGRPQSLRRPPQEAERLSPAPQN